MVETINNDQTARSLGEKFNLTTVLCNKETDSKTTISFLGTEFTVEDIPPIVMDMKPISF